MTPYSALILGLAIVGATTIIAITFRYTPVVELGYSSEGKPLVESKYSFDHWTGNYYYRQ
jgi:hypothetical protein